MNRVPTVVRRPRVRGCYHSRMGNPVPQARQQLLDSIEELARQTERIQAHTAAVGIATREIRPAFDQVHKALYAIHTRLDALEERSM